jgi:ATP-dependent Clp protease ATP-binding subunit ClpA
MATLHVRNVPDPLYEWLRACAAANGRSIGAEAVVALEGVAEGAMIGSVAGSVQSPWRRRVGPFEHFSARGRGVVADAQAEAAGLGAGSVGPEHLLLGLLREPEGAVSVVLAGAGLDYDRVRTAVEESGGIGSADVAAGRMPFTPGAKKALELALRECIAQHSVAIEPEHLVLGIAGAGEGVAPRLLAGAGLGTGEMRQALTERVVTATWTGQGAEHGFRVVELEGDAAEWERRLNDHAARGHELVDIVDRRAIFRLRIAR